MICFWSVWLHTMAELQTDLFIYLLTHFYLFCLSSIDICVHGHGHIFLRDDLIITSLYKSISYSSLNTEKKQEKFSVCIYNFTFFFFLLCYMQSSVVVTHWLSCPLACGSQLPNQGSNSYPLHWKGDSLPLDHQGNSKHSFSFL